ncbi:MAG: flagellar basal body P-ring protein FlgI [Gemmatimonadales bacterium]
MRKLPRHFWWWLIAEIMFVALIHPAHAQEVRVRDLVLTDVAPPVRLMGYGLVTGLSGTGDRVTGMNGSRQTVQSIVNLLRRFEVEVPPEVLRTKNVAAVLVTAEVSPYLRPGGRFEVSVSSLGDAQSLRGGVLWMTPLVADAGGKPFAGAQGTLLTATGAGQRTSLNASTTGRIPAGGVLESELPHPQLAAANMLLLRDPDVGTATRIAAAIDSALGPGQAGVVDPGAIKLALKDTSAGLAGALTKIRDLKVRPTRVARVIVDGHDGTVVAGGELLVGEAMVSHAGITLSIGEAPDTVAIPGSVRVPAGTTVQRVATALHAMQATAGEIAAVFEALRQVGAISAEVIVR